MGQVLIELEQANWSVHQRTRGKAPGWVVDTQRWPFKIVVGQDEVRAFFGMAVDSLAKVSNAVKKLAKNPQLSRRLRQKYGQNLERAAKSEVPSSEPLYLSKNQVKRLMKHAKTTNGATTVRFLLPRNDAVLENQSPTPDAGAEKSESEHDQRVEASA
jgi:hypothetical protein